MTAREDAVRIQETLLLFWFGSETDDARLAAERSELWWAGKAAVDDEIRARFGALRESAQRGELDDWARTPRGRLVLIILLDQFSRNIHRGTAEAFAADAKALRLALEGIDRKEDACLRPVERVFLYMPLVHAEDLDVQNRAVELFEKLLRSVPPEQVGMFEGFLGHARGHRDVVLRFGRFPHRNAALGRTAKDDEQEFLRRTSGV